MSGENIYNLLGREALPEAAAIQKDSTVLPRAGKPEVHTKEVPKPAYSTFYEKGKEYDGTNPRFYKQRDAVIGKSVGETVYPQNYLKKGEGVRAVVPPIHKEKMYTKPPVNDGRAADVGSAAGAADPSGGQHGSQGGAQSGAGGGSNSGSADGLGLRGSGVDTDKSYPGFAGYGDNDGVMGVPKSRKNFIASNIVEVSNMVPKNRKDQPSYATDRKDFGQVPTYLGRVKQEVEAEKSFVRALDEQKTQRRQQVYDQYVYKLPADEQASLVAALKRKLQQDTTALSSMPFSLDTISAAKKKGELQRSINDVESALAKLEKEAIFVYRDDPVNGQWTKGAALEEAKKYVATTTTV